jgi:hypothetical protein
VEELRMMEIAKRDAEPWPDDIDTDEGEDQ